MKLSHFNLLSYGLVASLSTRIAWFQQVSILPHGWSLEIPGGRGGGGGLKSKTFRRKCEAKVKFPPGEGGAKQNTFCGGSMDIFQNYTLHLVYSCPYLHANYRVHLEKFVV